MEHDLAAPTEQFRGAQVVPNAVGPSARCGHEVAHACVAIGAQFAEQVLVLSLGLAQRYTIGGIAANICPEPPAWTPTNTRSGRPMRAPTNRCFPASISPASPCARRGARRNSGPIDQTSRRCAVRCHRGRIPGPTPPRIRCTLPDRSAARTASSTATAMTSRPRYSTPVPPRICCSNSRRRPGSLRAARHSGTGTCSVPCAVSGLVLEAILEVHHQERGNQRS